MTSRRTGFTAYFCRTLEKVHVDSGASVFPVGLLYKLAKTPPAYTKLMVHRLVAAGRIRRITTGVYMLPRTRPDILDVMSALDKGAVESMESLLARTHIIQQHVTRLTCVTKGAARRFAVTDPTLFGKDEIVFRHIGEKLFFGLMDAMSVWPEKALLDLIHTRLYGRMSPLPSGFAWNCELLDMKRLREFKVEFPPPVRRIVWDFVNRERKRVWARPVTKKQTRDNIRSMEVER